ncbi:MAG: glycine--tRNA ligase [Candidatus Andersenbacteria bacterium RIFCSPHIGHO2_12_FULL_46_9]|nr:MAG: Glycine-tRNA ligase [Parcubacteria group bacterium GW2011_GWA2_45_14]OGY34569.1 MAG: glycine--tRNA ligase [Candidatus Andersenbacteria bacterium RIFCSPHIGHO2_02_FULL_46_16]OGY36361.1 MAG: glycine--tRNA ligase [Candidatus Andersenbacteria bacterium RIFCSPHIGHO2_12_FULL_46_9]OGY37854.1 MAG: glycine--tRNA ligase [Candidatus Andersenbacteria bacterium RIFCSPLOWO2_02_FULL_46_11]HBE89698.1 glycine--tRNA ligase [Candidatus Andersenbacteria bacterium]
MEKIINLAKNRGFIFPDSEIYGGWANSWDFGPLGVELKNNIKQAWWKRFVQGRLDMVGLETAIIMNPKVWEASGHVDEFTDPLVECKKCHRRSRADELEKGNMCPDCGEKDSLTVPANFNLLFKTFVGPKENDAAVAYLRPETAQGMFVDWPAVLASTRKRLPFGIAQIGKAFRNEITPGNYVFRTREFEQMEIEYFIEPTNWETEFDKWLNEMRNWLTYCGIDSKLVHEVEVAEEDRAFYSKRTVDIELDWPFGQKELYGLAYRGDWDLSMHAKQSGREMNYADTKTGQKFIPHVIEPTFGVERTVLAMLLSAYREEDVRGEKRVVLGLPAWAAPYQVAVLPLSSKPELIEKSRRLAESLTQNNHCDFDTTQSIGKRYRRQDEIGTPFCVTVDFDSLEDHAVTIRDRDTMQQERVVMTRVEGVLRERLKNKGGLK